MPIRPRNDIYRTYWYFATERQNIFYKKLRGEIPPFSPDPIFQTYKFCNAYRAADRVSQFLIKDVIYSRKFNPEDTLFRIFLFRLFNKISTWQYLEQALGEIILKSFNKKIYSDLLNTKRLSGETIYGNAYILCANNAFNQPTKHDNHLTLLEKVFVKEKIGQKFLECISLEELFNTLKTLPLIGDFMAYQIAIDFNYSPFINFDENDFTVAGPGAVRGIRKCFVDTGDYTNADIIKYMVDSQSKEFKRFSLDFQPLFGRSLHAIDCQGLFCETDKYTRASNPELASNRKIIKTKFIRNPEPINYFFPPKWKITY